jgi:hypothetical protein
MVLFTTETNESVAVKCRLGKSLSVGELRLIGYMCPKIKYLISCADSASCAAYLLKAAL